MTSPASTLPDLAGPAPARSATSPGGRDPQVAEFIDQRGEARMQRHRCAVLFDDHRPGQPGSGGGAWPPADAGRDAAIAPGTIAPGEVSSLRAARSCQGQRAARLLAALRAAGRERLFDRLEQPHLVQRRAVRAGRARAPFDVAAQRAGDAADAAAFPAAAHLAGQVGDR